MYPTNKASKYTKQKLTELKNIAKVTITIGTVKDFEHSSISNWQNKYTENQLEYTEYK